MLRTKLEYDQNAFATKSLIRIPNFGLAEQSFCFRDLSAEGLAGSSCFNPFFAIQKSSSQLKTLESRVFCKVQRVLNFG